MKKKLKSLWPVMSRVLLVVFIFVFLRLPLSGAAINTLSFSPSPRFVGVGYMWPVAIGLIGIAVFAPFHARKVTLHLSLILVKVTKVCGIPNPLLLFDPEFFKLSSQLAVARLRIGYLRCHLGIGRLRLLGLQLRLHYLIFKRDFIHKERVVVLFSSTNV